MTSCLNCGHEDDADFLFCPKCGTKAPESADATDPLLGRTLNDKYRVLAEIGSGAMGTVYRGEHVVLKKKVALKVLHTDLQLSDEQLQRFQREGIAAGKFSHPNAIQIFDFDRAEGRVVYLAMEFVEGMNLRNYLRSKGKLSVAVAIQLMRQILGCLAEAHDQGIIHRDLKPDNIMVVPGAGKDVRIKVLDFGLSKLVDVPGKESAFLTQAGRILGTPLYMSPEQSAGDETDSRSDLYAVGLMLYEALAGARPFDEESMSELLFSRATKEAPSLHVDHPELRIPEQLDTIVSKSLQRKREDRYQTAHEMLRALESVPMDESSWSLGGTSIVTTQAAVRARHGASASTTEGAATVATGPAAGRSSGKRTIYVVAGIALLAVASVVGTMLAGGGIDLAPPPPPLVSQIPVAERTPAQDQYVRLLELTRSVLNAGNLQGARTQINDALRLECVDAEAYLLQAEIFHAQHEDDLALASYREALEKDGSYVDARVGIAWLHIDREEWEDAATHLEAASEKGAEAGAVVTAKGVLALRTGNREEAESLLREATELDAPATAWLYLGQLLLDARGYEDAVDALVEAKRADPTEWRAPAWLGNAYLALDRKNDAETQWNASLELRDSVDVRRSLATLYLDSNRVDQAKRFLSESIGRYERDSRLRVLRAVALQAESDVRGATDELRQALDFGADDGESRTLLALLYHASGELDLAKAQYERVLADLGDVPRANLGLGVLLFEREEYARAAERLASVLEFEPNNLDARFYLGLLHMNFLGDAEKARTHLARYVELGGPDGRVDGWLRQLGG